MPGEGRFLAERSLTILALESDAGVDLAVPAEVVFGAVFLAAILAFKTLPLVFARHVHL